MPDSPNSRNGGTTMTPALRREMAAARRRTLGRTVGRDHVGLTGKRGAKRTHALKVTARAGNGSGRSGWAYPVGRPTPTMTDRRWDR